MTTQIQTQRSFVTQIVRGFCLLFVLASALFGAFFASLSPMGSQPAEVQAEALQSEVLSVAAQETDDPEAFICLDDKQKAVFTSTEFAGGECERYSDPPSIGLNERGVVFANFNDFIQSIALADVDGDGDLDIATASDNTEVRFYDDIEVGKKTESFVKVYLNQSGQFLLLNRELTNSISYLDITQELAWGDVDNDGDLDLATANVGDDKLYIMEMGEVSTTITLPDIDLGINDDDDGLHLKRTTSVAWGDVNGDGQLDLALGNYGRTSSSKKTENLTVIPGSIRIYSFATNGTDGNITSTLEFSQNVTIPYTTSAWVTDLAWSDYDSDDDLDLLVGLHLSVTTELSNTEMPMVQLYQNESIQGAKIELSDPIMVTGTDNRQSFNETLVATADIDKNGSTDFATKIGRYSFKIVYGTPSICKNIKINAPFAGAGTELHSLAWGDVDGDGDLDLAAGLRVGSNRIYLNQKGCINPTSAWESEYEFAGAQYATRSLAWGDIDNDGDLDLVAGGFPIGQIYFNDSFTFKSISTHAKLESAYLTQQFAPLSSVALGDVDNDGDLDIARTTYSQPVEILLNNHGVFSTTSNVMISPSISITTHSNLHFGYINDDNFLDLYVASRFKKDTAVYVNEFARKFIVDPTGKWSNAHFFDGSVLADIDRDEQLELLRNEGTKLYINDEVTTTIVTFTIGIARTTALGDADNDGDLDIAITTRGSRTLNATRLDIYESNHIFPNGVSKEPTTIISGSAVLRGLAWGDMNGDGYLDLAVATNGFDQVYLNQSGKLQTTPAWTSFVHDNTWRLAWGDADGDGDLDLATANSIGRPQASPTIFRVYRNANGRLHPEPAWQSEPVSQTTSIAWGDLDDDGVAELVTPDAYYKLNRPASPVTSTSASGVKPHIAVAIDRFSNPITESSSISALAIANFHAMPFVREQQTIPITFTLFHPFSNTFTAVSIYYSLNGGGQWYTATDTNGNNQLFSLSSSPFPTRTQSNTHSFQWDVLKSNLLGQYEDVVIRVVANLSNQNVQGTETVLYTNSVPSISTIPYVSSQTYPFRVRGKQIRVVNEAGSGMANALIYRIPKGNSTRGEPIGHNGVPFHTDQNGYLVGRGEINEGDQLLALAPVDDLYSMSWTVGITDTLHLYYTSGSPNSEQRCQTGTEVTAINTEVLTVTAACPLVLHDLDVSLEWDATKEPAYLEQMKFNLLRASSHLYNFTGGQMALGKVSVFQDADLFAYAHVNIHTSNRLRPHASIGGIVMTDTARVITDSAGSTTTHTYGIGQLHMGAVWNRYGEPNPNPSDDWALVFAHELGHYLLFLEDTYIGLRNTVEITEQELITEPVLIKVDSCEGSAMGDVYSYDNRGFIANQTDWYEDAVTGDRNCVDTLANLQLNSTEWETIRHWYPQLITPTAQSNTIPMRFAFTTVEIVAPSTATSVLENQDFYLRYQSGEGDVASSEARTFLVRDEDKDGIADFIFDLGNAIGTQNLLRTHGVQPGDQLCVFDRVRSQSGCETVREGDEEIGLFLNTTWNPVIQVTPITSLTFAITIVNQISASSQSLLHPDVQFYARVFPEYATDPTVAELIPVDSDESSNGIAYSGIITLTSPAMAGHIQISNSINSPTMQTIVAFRAEGGGPGDHKGIAGGDRRAGGGGPGDHKGIAGGDRRTGLGGPGDHKGIAGVDIATGAAPLLSPDGQMLFFATAPLGFITDTFYLIQDMAGLPELISSTVAIGRGYNLIATTKVSESNPLVGSISFQYNGLDVLLEKADEAKLSIHYWDGSGWCRLSTYRDPFFNLASARSQGPGIYALLATVDADSRATTIERCN